MFKENGEWVWEPGGEPATLKCYICAKPGSMDDGPERKVVDVGVGNPADPTEWYKLDCGHTII